MELTFNHFSLSLFAAALISGLTTFSVFIKSGQAVRTFSLLMAGVTIWAVAYAFELSVINLSDMLFWIRFEYIGIALIPAFWLLFCLQFTGYDSSLSRSHFLFIFLLPVLTLLFVWTNDWHHLHYRSTSVVEVSGIYLLNIEIGIWYIIHTLVFYLYLLMGIALLIMRYRRSNRLLKRQITAILAAASIPWLANIIYLSGFRPLGHIDSTPYAFVLTGVVISYALLRFKLFQFLPVAREKIIEEMNEGVLILDHQFRIMDYNPAITRFITGIRNESIGTSVFDQISEYKTLADSLIKQKAATITIEKKAGRQPLHVEIHIKPFYKRSNLISGYFLIFRDVTRHKNFESELILARTQAESANRAKSDFLAHMSHEIRTPLNGIIGFVDLLQNSELNDSQRQYLSIVDTSAKSLLDIINDILDLSKIESGKLQLDPEELDLQEMSSQIVEMFTWEARKKELKLIQQLSPDLPRYILADPMRLRQILVNLLGNAVKFTQTGTIEFRIESLPSDNKRKLHLRFSIIDTGIGIAKKNQKKIFQSFTQEDISTTKRYSGTGLGLSISNKLLALMNSELQLISELGKGSTFFFDIHCKATKEVTVGSPEMMNLTDIKSADLSNEDTIDSPHKKTGENGFTVLIAEDNAVNTLLVQSIIQRHFPKAIILKALNGKQAVELFESEHPDLIFMDVQMPVMNGYEATVEIRKKETGNQRTPVIALTAGTIQGEKDKSQEVGMDGYLLKPVLAEDIVDTIMKWVINA
ncbi:MAG: histidine kinase N-terminal 7TM domain-containing protein [Balneolaceae bacterium]